jgi:L-asparaginase
VYGYVNMNGIAVDAFVKAGTKAIIYAGVGEGTTVDTGIESALIDARKKGVVIVRSSRVGNGMVTRSVENRDDELSFIASDTLSPQKARILTMLALMRTNDVGQIQRMFYEYGEGWNGFEYVESICDPLHHRMVQSTRCECCLIFRRTRISKD